MGGIARALLSLRGRLRRGQFWLAFFVVLVGGAYSSQEQNSTATIIGLLTLYVALCVYGKRLHDFGKSAWYMIMPLGATFGMYAYTAAALSQANRETIRQLFEMLQVTYLGLLVLWLVMTLWVGIHPSQKGDNRFGMDTSERRRLPTAPPRSAH
jgi:uncharacterized membrane protein YhaH (DUF805 family)